MLAGFLCFTASVQKFFGRCMTRPYKRACHQTNFSYGGFVKETPFFFSFYFFYYFVYYFLFYFYKGAVLVVCLFVFFYKGTQAAGVPPYNSGDMRWSDDYRKIVHVSVIVVVIVIYMCPTITKLTCALIPTLKQRHVNVACFLVA